MTLGRTGTKADHRSGATIYWCTSMHFSEHLRTHSHSQWETIFCLGPQQSPEGWYVQVAECLSIWYLCEKEKRKCVSYVKGV